MDQVFSLDCVRGEHPCRQHSGAATLLLPVLSVPPAMGCSSAPIAHVTHTHTHGCNFSLSSLGGGAPVDFSNPSSFFLIIVCEPCGVAALTACEFGVMPVISL